METVTDLPKGAAQRDWVRRLIDLNGMTPTRLAELSGVSQPTITRFLNGTTESLSPRTLRAISSALPTATVPAAIKSDIDRAAGSRPEHAVNAIAPFAEIPVWGLHPLRGNTAFRINPTPIQMLRRPPHLSASRKLAAFYAPDESMSPRWRMGEIVIVDLARPATVGGVCLAQLSPVDDANGTEVYLFRHFDGRTNGKLRLSSYDESVPAEEIPQNRLLDIHRVLEWQDMLSPGA